MTRWDKFFGSFLVLITGGLIFRAVCQDIINHPSWIGIAYAASDLIGGCFIVASVWRDRL